jgi:hypothetical protein
MAALAFSACARPTPVVTIAPGLHPRLTPAAAEQLARDAIDLMDVIRPGSREVPSVLAITAIPGGPTLAGYLAGVSWIVEARGDFVEQIGLGERAVLRRVRGITVHISDDDGSVISADFTD